MKRGSKFGKAVMIVFFCAAFVTVFSYIVMSLWNAILPAVLGVKLITFWQAMGILLLSKILFGSFGGGGGWKHKGEHFKNKFKQRMQDKWSNMNPEERQKFVKAWRNRCGADWKAPFEDDNSDTAKPGAESWQKPGTES